MLPMLSIETVESSFVQVNGKHAAEPTAATSLTFEMIGARSRAPNETLYCMTPAVGQMGSSPPPISSSPRTCRSWFLALRRMILELSPALVHLRSRGW